MSRLRLHHQARRCRHWWILTSTLVVGFLMAPLVSMSLAAPSVQNELATPSPTSMITAAVTLAITATPTITNTPLSGDCVSESVFVDDRTIRDGEIVQPGSTFTKIWRVKNTGTCHWDSTYQVQYIRGEQLGVSLISEIPPARPGQEVDIAVKMVAPEDPGNYTSVWGLYTPGRRPFGEQLTVVITVPSPTPTDTPTPLPTSTPTLPPASATETAMAAVSSPVAVTPELTRPPDEDDTGNGGLLQPLGLGILAVALLGAVGIGVFYLRGQGPFAGRGQQPLSPLPFESPIHEAPPPGTVSEPPPLVATTPPPSGVPYLGSQGRHVGAVYCSLRQPSTTIGRAPDNDFVIDEHFTNWQTVSREHARIERDGQDIVVVDLDSENGVYVNDQRTHENLLRDGDTVGFGQVQFKFHLNQEGRAA